MHSRFAAPVVDAPKLWVADPLELCRPGGRSVWIKDTELVIYNPDDGVIFWCYRAINLHHGVSKTQPCWYIIGFTYGVRERTIQHHNHIPRLIELENARGFYTTLVACSVRPDMMVFRTDLGFLMGHAPVFVDMCDYELLLGDSYRVYEHDYVHVLDDAIGELTDDGYRYVLDDMFDIDTVADKLDSFRQRYCYEDLDPVSTLVSGQPTEREIIAKLYADVAYSLPASLSSSVGNSDYNDLVDIRRKLDDIDDLYSSGDDSPELAAFADVSAFDHAGFDADVRRDIDAIRSLLEDDEDGLDEEDEAFDDLLENIEEDPTALTTLANSLVAADGVLPTDNWVDVAIEVSLIPGIAALD